MQCIYPDGKGGTGPQRCENTARTRGLCHGHYQTMRSYVRRDKASERDLERRGLLMPKGTGGQRTYDHSAFTLGSKVVGYAPRAGDTKK